jgi:hypothetical protein
MAERFINDAIKNRELNVIKNKETQTFEVVHKE